jgi:hypothetical protein
MEKKKMTKKKQTTQNQKSKLPERSEMRDKWEAVMETKWERYPESRPNREPTEEEMFRDILSHTVKEQMEMYYEVEGKEMIGGILFPKRKLKRKKICNDEGEEIIRLVDNLDVSHPRLAKTMELRKALDSASEEMLDTTGEAFFICEHMIKQASIPPNHKEILRRNYYRYREQLGIDSLNGLPRMLTENVASNWLRVQITEHEYSRVSTQASTLRELEFLEKRLNGAHTKLNNSVKTLANAVKNLGPSANLQIIYAENVEQQANINR